MRSFLSLGALSLLSAASLIQACSSSDASGNPVDGTASDDGGEKRVIACPPATDASVAAATDAGLQVTIIKPSDGQSFSSTDKVPLLGTATDPKEGSITDPTRMIWNKVDPTAAAGIVPEGEGPQDTAGPFPPGTYTIRFDVSNKDCVTGAASVKITVK